MPIRNKHRIGDYLMVDDESGFTFYRSEMVRRWDGAYVHVNNNEIRNPQEFVRAKNDPKALDVVRPEVALSAACAVFFDLFVPGTSIETAFGAASHLFDVGIGEAEIDCSFVVR
ncbi:MAG: hypothetical protein V3R41_06535 [Gammaproteobacteria bacterium]